MLLYTFLRYWHNCQILRIASAIGVDSNFMKETLTRSGLCPERIVVLPTNTYQPDDTVFSEQVTAPGPTVLYVGALTENKGILALLESVRLIPDLHLWIAGEGYLRSQVEQKVRQAGMEDRVTFWGWVNQGSLATLYEACNLVAVPSLWPEPFGLVGVEAMFHGKPVVAFDVGGIRDWLID